MNFDKLAITLYDVFGYLLPGYVVLFAVSLVEATFVGTWFLSLVLIRSHALAFAVVAYFLGQACHAIASWLTEHRRLRAVVQASRERLSPAMFGAVRAELEAAYGLSTRIAEDTLESYLLADAYVIAAGAGTERDVVTAREGFFKQSIVAFMLLAIALMAAVIGGGARFQTQPGMISLLPFWPTVAFAVATVAIGLLFRMRFGFYHRIKINNTMLLFLALRARERKEAR